MDEVAALYEISLNRLSLLETNGEILKQVGYSITQQGGAFRELQFAFFNHKSSYIYKSMLGDPVEFQFDWAVRELTIMYMESKVTMTMSQFNSWLAYTDLLLSLVLPLGTLVELRLEKLSPKLVEMMKEAQIPCRAVILGIRVLLGPESSDYIDYLVSLYPYGLRPDVEPLYIPAYYIKEVLQEGHSDDFDKDYVKRQYRVDYFKQNLVSEIYHE